MKKFIEFIGVLLVSSGIVALAYVGYIALSDPCGPLKARHADKAFSEYQSHLEAVDRSLQNHIPAPSYLVAQLRSDLRAIQTSDYPSCQEPIRVALECATNNMLVYADRWSQESGNPVADQAQRKYQSCMTDYFYAMSELEK